MREKSVSERCKILGFFFDFPLFFYTWRNKVLKYIDFITWRNYYIKIMDICRFHMRLNSPYLSMLIFYEKFSRCFGLP